MDGADLPPAADDVVAAYLETVAEPDHASLLEWVRRYPQYERELTEATVTWGEMRHLPPASAANRIDEDVLVRRSMSIVRTVLRRRRGRGGNAPPAATLISGILDEAGRQKIRIADVAAAAGLSRALVRLLDRRLTPVARIPREAIESIAGTLRCAPVVLTRYLSGPPILAAGTLHRADQAPELAEPMDFFDAVREDRSLTDEQRAYWLSLEPVADRSAMRPGDNDA